MEPSRKSHNIIPNELQLEQLLPRDAVQYMMTLYKLLQFRGNYCVHCSATCARGAPKLGSLTRSDVHAQVCATQIPSAAACACVPEPRSVPPLSPHAPRAAYRRRVSICIVGGGHSARLGAGGGVGMPVACIGIMHEFCPRMHDLLSAVARNQGVGPAPRVDVSTLTVVDARSVTQEQ